MSKINAVVTGVKLKILKANHNKSSGTMIMRVAVVTGVKLKILKANHNGTLNVLLLPLLLLLV